MTVRSVIIGLLCAAFLAGVTYFNDFVINQTFLIGNLLPIGVYGLLILFLLLGNPVLGRIGSGWALRAPEIAVIIALMFAVCGIPGSGLLRNFNTVVMFPHQLENTEPGWQESGIVDLAPDIMLADPGEEGEALGSWLRGLSVSGEWISPGDIPWHAWSETLGFWMPLLILFWGALLGLTIVLHRQWSQYEHLPYPLAAITNSFLPGPDGENAPVFRNRLFLIAAGVVMVIHLNNYFHSLNPGLIEVKLQHNFASIFNNLPSDFRAGGLFNRVFNFKLYFTIIGVAYFLARDVSFSIGFAPILWAIVAGIFNVYGVNIRGSTVFEPGDYMRGGAVLGLLVMVLYTGRHYYLQTLRAAVFVGPRPREDTTVIWAMRIFLVCFTASVFWLTRTGLEWQLSLILMAFIAATFTVMGRILAETGLLMIQPGFSPAVVLGGLIGTQAFGPEVVLIMSLVCVVFMIDPRDSFMPFIVNAIKLGDLQRVEPRRLGPWLALAALVGLAVAVPATLYWQYQGGQANIDEWTTNYSSKAAFRDALDVQRRLEAQGALEDALERSGWSRVLSLSNNRTAWFAFIAGGAAAMLFAWMRLRFVRWPLHPLIFVIWTSWAGYVFAVSFLIGCGIKAAVTRYAGEATYQRMKPAMVGLIFGELLAALICILINFGIYLATGEPPDRFVILPS